MHFFLPKFFWATPPGILQNGAPKKPFFERLDFWYLFDISRYLTDKYFDIVWGCHPSGDPPKWTPQKLIFWTAQLRVPMFYDISRYLTDKCIDIVWGCQPPGNPPKWTPQKSIFERPKVEFYFFFDISRYLTDKYIDIVWGCHPPGPPKCIPQKSSFWIAQLGCLSVLISADI